MTTNPIRALIEDPSEVEYLRGRRVARRRRLWTIAVASALILGVLTWKIANHLSATFWLEMNSYVVTWGVDRANWMQGGVTSVRYTSRHGINGSESPHFDLRYLLNLNHLVELDLSTLHGMQDADLARLDELTGLQHLNLDRSHHPDWVKTAENGLTDSTLARIGRLEPLTELHLGGQRITDDGLAALKKIQRLESLDLVETEITDAGLAHLQRLPKLKDLDLSRTKVTNRGVDAFQSLRPEVRVIAEHLPVVPWNPTATDPPKAPR